MGALEQQAIANRKLASVVFELTKIYCESRDDVWGMFLNSDTCRKLFDVRTKYWRECVPYIVDAFIAEINNMPSYDNY